ncbi:hypothetical protein [Geotalea uraniireducens]|uniref:Uncharacterized protein n=1 Tax=Geotalea uraniireducens (strain Rf4) TaxID=351605 RepID=A5G840_GEOUR|nr:hypothetical protein [Geotalea uraniireducens]ABQ27958.1 hypothetical protein Gura_3807 [Geotalea uraniireducens Rf4]
MKNLFNKFVKFMVNKHSDSHSANVMTLPTAYTHEQKAINAWTMTTALRRLYNQGFTVSTILDVGASDGKWTKDTLTIFSNAQYILFEPLEERRYELDLLRENFANVDFELAAI